ncbi:SDR family NAD(P)-dependent oxidoreductase [Rhodococcus sp. SGAir0479]|uniref:SDR family NAD(P)-dependent oxidoreductase n=1 Tax=Rhodococcus sp. SGAir0479 TaxID=2567884 RepID=UPI0010CD01F3|nr:SDR family NAD(P)-dependent oxidoreductase [Rhodococcus sp. SGAir0479]QCQ90701.1 SDR family NAD(P)-dependent oxidoreductase [Rhodococcus sp. SGAir0479]
MRGIDPGGRVAVVTGGARGIGLATAAALHAAGARVAIGDLDGAPTAQTAERLGVHGGPLDVTDPASVEAFLDDVESRLGPVSIWVNNAGIMPIGPVLAQDDAVVRRAVNVNVLGVMNGARAAARRMVTRGDGRIVNVASIAGRIPAPGMVVYSGTKFAVVGFGDALDAELAARGVRVSTVLPSFTRTALISGTAPGPLTRPIPPEQVAATVLRVLTRGRRQAVVPRRLSTGSAVWQLFPRPAARGLRRTLGLDTVFLDVDSGRADYDARIAGDAQPSE